MPYENDMQAVIDAARQGIDLTPVNPRDQPYFLRADGTVVDLTKYREVPARESGTINVYDVASLNTVIARMGDGRATIYVNRDVENPQIVAVMNDHDNEFPGWRDFRVQLQFRKTPQWVKWCAIDNKLLPQETFAEFIEDNVLDVTRPSGAEMLEIALTFAATKTANFKKAVRLDNSTVQFTNIENMEAQAGSKGEFSVPEKIELALAPFVGTPPYAVPARFRFKLEGGSLKLGIKMERKEELMQAVIGEMVRGIALSETVYLLEGPAP